METAIANSAECYTEGGLRARDQFFKMSEAGRPLISIVTVVRNGQKHIEETIKSVINQEYDNIEYIVMDGCSTDSTVDIIKKYDDSIAYWVSEPDKGKYDAMNKASKIASGDYILFINADDYLSSSRSIEETISSGFNQQAPPLMIIGRVRLALDDKELDWFLPISERLVYKHNPVHQAVLIGKQIYKSIFYITDLDVSSDSMFWEELRRKDMFKFKFIDNVMSTFRLNGVSSGGRSGIGYVNFIKEHIRVYRYSNEFSMLRILKRIVTGTIKMALIDIFGEKIYYKHCLYNTYRFKKWRDSFNV